MKMKSTQLSILALFAFMTLAFIYGCKKEEPLKPNPLMELYQTEHYAGGDDFGFGDTTGTGGGGGTDTTGGGGTDTTGGGDNSNQYFRADIDGVTQSFPSISYKNTGSRIELLGEKTSTFDFIEIQVFDPPSTGDTVIFDGPNNAEYVNQSFVSHISYNGAIIFTRVEAGLLEGKFYFDANAPNDTNYNVSVTNGEFLINR